jgi:ribosomal protein L37AE/L43A
MQQAVTLLQTWWTTLVTQPWVDDLYADMQDIRSALDHAHGADKPKPLGNCFTCERAIYARPGETMVRCSGCGRKYDGLAIVRLEVQRRREASA